MLRDDMPEYVILKDDQRKRWAIVSIPGRELTVLGINDPWIWGVYLLCILSTLLCVIYGLTNWNKGGEVEEKEISEEAAWEEKEEEMQDKELGV
jgi:hypothetical protein